MSISLWLQIAKTDPSKAYCPECSYPLRWTGEDFWADQSPFVCDDCGFGKKDPAKDARQSEALL